MGSDASTPLQIGTLFRTLPSSRSQRWGLLKRFFAEWYGQLRAADGCTLESIHAAEQRLQLVLPPALREWYEIAGRRTSVWSCQDHFLEPDSLRIEDDRLIICIENQAVVKWAIRLDALQHDDPPVLVSDQCNSHRWLQETPSVSLFALSQMLMNAKFSGAALFSANGQATEEPLAAIVRNYQRLDFPDFNWPPHPTRLYGDPDLLIETDGDTWIWVSGRSETTFRPAIDLITNTGVMWEQLVYP